ncbi:MAG TPA: hypothetical protein VN922_06970 [Bacteroidia bacterium]|jgi:hypothetical protein|nr:hypothetical protein [Bacteroidia bacterium]
MKDLNKIAGLNILFIIVYSIVIRFAWDKSTEVVVAMCLVPIQVLANFITSMSYYGNRKTELGNSYLLTAFLVLIIGFGACLTNLNS